METTYTVIIEYHTGKKNGQKLTYEGVKKEDILGILGDITQDQLANAEVSIISEDIKENYEDFLIGYYTIDFDNPNEMN